MIHPSDPEFRTSPCATAAARRSRAPSCGCRLAATGEAFVHFNPLGGRDARGCRVDCADAAPRRQRPPDRRRGLTGLGRRGVRRARSGGSASSSTIR